eukprot:scaffold11934_cov41-Phaeocystis_antarctica.AAC.1
MPSRCWLRPSVFCRVLAGERYLQQAVAQLCDTGVISKGIFRMHGSVHRIRPHARVEESHAGPELPGKGCRAYPAAAGGA